MLTISNAAIFDGQKRLPGRHSVTLEAGRILSIGQQPHVHDGENIDIGGMTLMPGLITGHLHSDFFKFEVGSDTSNLPLGKEFPPGVMMAIGVRTCRVLLESGFTGYLGASCSNFIDSELQLAIAEDIIPGPRIRASGHHIGTTADTMYPKKWWQRTVTPGTDIFGDGPDELRRMVRDQIAHGVEIIKVFAGGGHGINSRFQRNMSLEELEAVVNAAHERGAMVRAHVAGKDNILDCLALGVDIIDHGDEVDEECIDKMLKTGAAWVPSLIYLECLMKLGFAARSGIDQAHIDRTRQTLPLAHKAGVPILIGDDYSGVFRKLLDDDPLDHQIGNYARELVYYAEIDGLSPADILSWGTRNPGRFLAAAPLTVGVIQPGALADLIIVDGDPTVDIGLLSRPDDTLKAVIRDGLIVIDRLNQPRSMLS